MCEKGRRGLEEKAVQCLGILSIGTVFMGIRKSNQGVRFSDFCVGLYV